MVSKDVTTSLVDQLSTLNKESFSGDDDARAQVLAEAQRLVRRLEEPIEALKRITFGEPTLICALLVADKMRLFSALGSVGSLSKSVSELAAPLHAEEELVRRIMRHLAAWEVVSDLSGDRYGPTDLSAMLANPDNCVGFREVANRYIPIFAQAPAWFEENGYRVPRDAGDTVFQKALGSKGQSFFDWLQLPEHRFASDEFGRLMRLGVEGARSWLDVRRADDVVASWDGQSTLLVDVGGSIGQDAREFRRRYPDVRGKLVSQDLPATVAMAEKDQPQAEKAEGIIEFQPHDFFKEQPVKEARTYFMGSILHDWPDDDAQRILRNTAAAMKKGYSTLFLSEIVLPDTACHPQMSAIDICMMVELGAKERSREDWRKLLASEGLELIKVHSLPTVSRSVIEARLA